MTVTPTVSEGRCRKSVPARSWWFLWGLAKDLSALASESQQVLQMLVDRVLFWLHCRASVSFT